MKEGLNSARTVAFDADDTYLKTSEIYRKRSVSAASYLVIGQKYRQALEKRGLYVIDDREIDDLANQLVDKHIFPIIGNRLRKSYGVNPIIMEVAVLMAAAEIGLCENDVDFVNAALEEVRSIQKVDVPEIIAGSRETMTAVKEMGVNVIIVTHAGEEWANKKNEKYKIPYVTFCLDVNRTKSEQWEEFFEREGIEPSNFVIIGDSFWEDIWVPVFEKGASGVLLREKGHVYDYMEGMDERKLVILQKAIYEERFVVAKGIWEKERIINALQQFS